MQRFTKFTTRFTTFFFHNLVFLKACVAVNLLSFVTHIYRNLLSATYFIATMKLGKIMNYIGDILLPPTTVRT